MVIFLFLISCVISSFCQGLPELKHPSLNEETYLDQDVDGIVGGEEASIKDYPYQVALFIEDYFICGGFIVSENYILTAAHCAPLMAPENTTARAGSEFRNGTVIKIAEVTAHPDYNYETKDNDVGVLKTVDPIEFSDVIKAVPLPKKGRQMEGGANVVVSGWGRTKEGGQSAEHLMAVEVPVVDHAKCKKNSYPKLTHNMFCAGIFDLGGKDACQGDSGGPVQQDGMVVGIVSWGKGCARPKYPGVYTDIAAPAVRDFITEKTGL